MIFSALIVYLPVVYYWFIWSEGCVQTGNSVHQFLQMYSWFIVITTGIVNLSYFIFRVVQTI